MNRLSTGVAGLDEILLGGLLPGRVYLLSGQPGAGKTTLGLQFLIEGARRGESVLFVTLSESEAELRDNAETHGWDLGRVRFLDLHPDFDGIVGDQQYSIFHPADVELIPVARQIQAALDEFRPTRVVFDSLTQIRLLSRDPLRYHRQILALKVQLLGRGITSIFLGDASDQDFDTEISSIVQGVIALSLDKGREGMARRSVEVRKYRGSAYREGTHPLRLERGGVSIFPRLLALEHGQTFVREVMLSGVAGLDETMGGGFDRGTCTLITGNAGVGKTTLAMSILAQAARGGERGILYTFDEGPAEILYRSTTVGLAVDPELTEVRKVNPLLLYPDEFAGWVRREVEQGGTKVVVIDSLNGYSQSMPDEGYLAGHMHQLIGYLNRMGVTTFLINEISTLVGDFAATQYGLSYMADTIVIIRVYEYEGGVRKAIGTIKKRLSDHEKLFREFEITPRGLRVGNPLPNLRGILRGEAYPSYQVLDIEGASDA